MYGYLQRWAFCPAHLEFIEGCMRLMIVGCNRHGRITVQDGCILPSAVQAPARDQTPTISTVRQHHGRSNGRFRWDCLLDHEAWVCATIACQSAQCSEDSGNDADINCGKNSFPYSLGTALCMQTSHKAPGRRLSVKKLQLGVAWNPSRLVFCLNRRYISRFVFWRNLRMAQPPGSKQ